MKYVVCIYPFLLHLVAGFGFVRWSCPHAHIKMKGGNLYMVSSENQNGKSVNTDSSDFEQPMMGSNGLEGKKQVKCPDCDQCDGSGRIIGGIGQVLDWWPIKAYRPCPNFINRGGQYTRSGQNLDEIVFGRSNMSREN